jgi:hypothetical protein
MPGERRKDRVWIGRMAGEARLAACPTGEVRTVAPGAFCVLPVLRFQILPMRVGRGRVGPSRLMRVGRMAGVARHSAGPTAIVTSMARGALRHIVRQSSEERAVKIR